MKILHEFLSFWPQSSIIWAERRDGPEAEARKIDSSENVENFSNIFNTAEYEQVKHLTDFNVVNG